MSNDLRKQIYNTLNLKETEELVEIWERNDRVEWSELAFDVIREILQERLGEVPPQDEPVYEYSEDDTDNDDKNSDEIPAEYESAKEYHSAWGIFSFLVSLVAIVPGLLFMTSILLRFIKPGLVFFTLMYCISPVGCILGVGLANVGLREKNRKRLFPNLGLLISVVAFFQMLFIWMLFLSVGLPFTCLENLADCLK